MELREHLKYNFFDFLIDENVTFALYRLPREKEIHLVSQSSNQSETFDSLLDLNSKKGFVIAPFNYSERTPIVLIKPDIILTGEEIIFDFLHNSSFGETTNKQFSHFSEQSKATTFDHYQKGYSKFHEALESNTLKKLVLSRTFETVRNEKFSAGLSFQKACQKYPDNFIFLCNTPQTGTWLGCSPEILVSGKNGNWKTVALAGTLEISEAKNAVSWDKKNRLEQQIVIDYMHQQLLKAGIESTHSKPKTIQSGNLAHLKSEFTFHIDDSSKIGSLLELLHPSPAVCGFPKKEAFDFILENEGYDRKYYSGFLGYLDVDNQTDLFVNLRCMQIFDEKLRLFAGGGILPSSELMSEWKETEYKLQTILSIINE